MIKYKGETIELPVSAYNYGHTYRIAVKMGEDEMKRPAMVGFYRLSPAIMNIIENDYYHKNRYADFSVFFPVLLRELSKQYP